MVIYIIHTLFHDSTLVLPIRIHLVTVRFPDLFKSIIFAGMALKPHKIYHIILLLLLWFCVASIYYNIYDQYTEPSIM